MEAAGLYTAAAMAGVRVHIILTISVSIVTGEGTTSEERQMTFKDMMKIALKTAVKINEAD